MLDAIQWDSDLIRRYDQAGPRYTLSLIHI